MGVIKPKALKTGDTVAVVALSSGAGELFPHRVDAGVRALRELGFSVQEYPSARSRSGWSSCTAVTRAKEFNDAFRDPNVRAIIALTGGITANEVLPHLDYDLIARNPKIFCGYSDNGMIHAALLSRANLVSFYGPCLITQFGEHPRPLPYTVESFKHVLMKPQPAGKIRPSEEWTDEFLNWFEQKDLERPRALTRNTDGHLCIREGVGEGALVAGCPYTLLQMLATGFAPNLEGAILVLDIPEGDHPARGLGLPWVYSQIVDLVNAGVFTKIRGLLVGRGFGYSAEDAAALQGIVTELTALYSFPVIMNVNVGHADPNITLPLGVRARIDGKTGSIEILETAVVA